MNERIDDSSPAPCSAPGPGHYCCNCNHHIGEVSTAGFVRCGKDAMKYGFLHTCYEWAPQEPNKALDESEQ